MRNDVPLPSEIRESLATIGEVDLIVGIPSYNNARTIGHVVRAVQAGLAKYFPDSKAVIVNSDGGSTDGTREIVQQVGVDDYSTLLARHPVYPVHRIVTPYHGIPGKGSALRTVFQIASELNAKACAVVDADLRSIDPSWMDLLLTPVLSEGFDFVSPLYRRHKYDGTITNSIVYPLTRSLYGLRVRQPIGGDFGFSGRMARHYAEQDVWESDVARFGIDIWMTTSAITGGFKVCQAFLGAKIHDAKDPSMDLSQMLVQVVSSVFDLMGSRYASWKDVSGSRPVPLFGLEHTVGLEHVHVDTARMIRNFKLGQEELKGVWAHALPSKVTDQLEYLGALEQEDFHFPPGLWVRVLHDFALAYHRRVMDRSHLIKSLTPLYMGRVASFVLETANATADEVEALHENNCLLFESMKSELVKRWLWMKEDRDE